MDKTAYRTVGSKWLNCMTRCVQEYEPIEPDKTGPAILLKNWKALPSFWFRAACWLGLYYVRPRWVVASS